MHALVVQEQGSRVHLKDELLLVTKGDEVLRRQRLGEVHEVLVFGQVEVTTEALAALARRGVDVVFLSPQGYFRARLVGPGSAHVALRIEQVRRASDEAFAASVAGAMVAGKIEHQRQVLLRAQRRLKDEEVAVALGRLRGLEERCGREKDLERLRGFEGQAAALYFGQFGKLVRCDGVAFNGRTRRPPRDPVNACLSLGYTMLGHVVETEVQRCGLDPGVGFLHQPLAGRNSLALDLLEEFRPFMDTLVLRLFNRGQLGPADFERKKIDVEGLLAEASEAGATGGEDAAEQQGVYLNGAGRRIFLGEFYGRLREKLYYPAREGSFELRDIIREQGYQLARVVGGREETYRAFVPG